jgi:8-oxo-dGTP pyrophosphatase MutT (NUDIX family)
MKKTLCHSSLKTHIKENLSHFSRTVLSSEGLKRAAVAVTIVDYRNSGNIAGLLPETDDGAALILTRRSARLKNHAGQWALPGGSIDGKETVEETALRELEEEVGLHLEKNHLLGLLDDFVTRSGFHITPVLLWGGKTTHLQANPEEVASIHRIPCREFLRTDAPILDKSTESGEPVLFMPVGSTWIATPTAAILYQFREVALLGKQTRVAHFEQPCFAWR